MGRIPLHPFLAAAFPILSLYRSNLQFATPRDLAVPLLVALASAALAWLGIWAATRDARRSAQSTTLLIGVFHALGMGGAMAGELLTGLSKLWIQRVVTVPAGWVAPVVLVAGGWLLWRVWRRGGEPRQRDALLNLIGVFLVAVPLARTAPDELAHSRRPRLQPEALFGPADVAVTSRPHVFYILLDAYARQDILRDYFALDNEPFLKELEARGFQVARQSNSNYARTLLSLASSLNARYIRPEDGAGGTHHDPLQEMISANAVAETLEGLGYRVVSFDSGFDHANLRDRSDNFRTPFPRRRIFEQQLIDSTPLGWVWPEPGRKAPFDQARARFDYTLGTLPILAADRRPTFAFAHVMSPHPPFLHRADGQPAEEPGAPYYLVDGDAFHNRYGDDLDYIRGYRGQVTYLNDRLLRVVDAILRASREPPVIVIQSDHGSGLHYDQNDLASTDLDERFANLTAVLTPPDTGPPIRRDITPVNLFRVIFGQVFGAPLEELPESCYFSPFAEVFRYTDVTARVRRPGELPPEEGIAPAE